jgi:hypothetical protein
VLIQAADAAVDTVLGLLAGEDLSDRATAALGLLMAADAMLDRSQDLLNLPDADGEDGPVGTLARAFAVDAQPPTATITVTPHDTDWRGPGRRGPRVGTPAARAHRLRLPGRGAQGPTSRSRPTPRSQRRECLDPYIHATEHNAEQLKP